MRLFLVAPPVAGLALLVVGPDSYAGAAPWLLILPLHLLFTPAHQRRQILGR